MNACDDLGNTPLHCAYAEGLLNVAACVIALGADESKNVWGKLPIDCQRKI